MMQLYGVHILIRMLWNHKLNYLRRIIRNIRGEIDIENLIARGLKVGDNCNFQFGVNIDSSHCWHIQIGNNVTLAPRVMIIAHDASMKIHLGYAKIGKVKIRNNVFIGAGAIVLPNVSIGENSIIGAASLVTKDIPANVIAAGNPAKVLCSLDDFLFKHRNAMDKCPIFGEEYTLRQNIDDKMKQHMNEKLEDIGYVV